MRKPIKLEAWPVLVDADAEVCVDVYFHYYPGHPGVMNPPDRAEPPEPESVEIVKVEYNSGARTEIEEALMMESVRSLMDMEDGEFILEMEDACLQLIADEEDRMADAYHDHMIQARLEEEL